MEDERQVELDCIAAIYPEIQIDTKDPFSATIELQVNPANPVKVVFPASSDGLFPSPPPSSDSDQENEHAATNNIESHSLAYLPPLHLRISLPVGYPDEKPAKFELATTPAWLDRAYLDKLQDSGERMWEEAGRSSVVYGFIDSLQQAAENGFGFAETGKTLDIPLDFKISLLDYDIKATQAAFEKETFDCGVCLDPKKGSVCHRMIDCGHVFCVQCLQDFYSNAITEGDLASIRCLAPNCAKKRAEERTKTKKTRKSKMQLSPSELLQIPLEHEIVTRYVKLKHKADLESDKNTIYCPRKWCQGAARSKKHRKPAGLEDAESSGDESDTEATGPEKFRAGKDLLAVCEDCSFAFCSRCFQGWHGEFTICMPKTSTGELTEEDKASLEYLKMHTTPCPTCSAPAQKTHGCNHMICFKCHTHFCYLCSSWLAPANPYKHYNEEGALCYQRLWEREEGDGNDGMPYPREGGQVEIPPNGIEEAIAFFGADEPAAPEGAQVPEVEEPPPVPRDELEREGPLVLRINQIPRPVPAAVAPAVPDPPPANRRNGGNQRQPPQQAVGNRLVRPRNHQRQGQREDLARQRDAANQEAAQQAWVQMFVQMAMNDEEDLLDSDDDDDQGEGWEIPVR